ncbi:uncharacterized protein LOC144641530 [Oculina patagonica]
MENDVAGISKKSGGSVMYLQPKTPTTRTTACTTPKNVRTSTCSNRSCGLRRPSSPFVSPVIKRRSEGDSQENFSTPKRSKLYGQDHEKVHTGTVSESLGGNTFVSTPENRLQGCSQTERPTELLARKRDLIKMIHEKEELQRKLNLVKMYRNKNDLKELQCLIDKWRTVSQEAAERLLGKIQFDPRPTMSQLLSNLQVDKELIHFSEEDEGFY